MKTVLCLADLSPLFESVAAIMADKADELCAMDAKMGDGDLGLTMKKGFAGLPQILESIDESDIGKKLMKAGMQMSNLVPSTMGTLMASGIISGGKALIGADCVDATAFKNYLEGFAQGLIKRGKCARGDRTVLDAIGAGADAVADALSSQPKLTLCQAAEFAVSGARAGLEATKFMVPKFGKAAVHMEAAKGVIDQGAFAGYCMIEGYRNYICN